MPYRWLLTVVTLYAQLTRNLLAIATFLVVMYGAKSLDTRKQRNKQWLRLKGYDAAALMQPCGSTYSLYFSSIMDLPCDTEPLVIAFVDRSRAFDDNRQCSLFWCVSALSCLWVSQHFKLFLTARFFVFTTTTECHKSTVGFKNAYETAVFSSKYVSHFVYIFGVFFIVLIALVPYYSAAE